MKKLICLVCISGLSLAAIALGDDKNQGNGGSVRVRARGNAPAAQSAAPATSHQVTSARPMERSISRAPVRQRTYVSTPRVRSNATVRNNAVVHSTAANARVRSNMNASVRRNGANATVRSNANARVRNNVAVNRE